MSKFRMVGLFALFSAGAVVLPLVACGTTAVAANPHSASPIGKQLAELNGSDTVAGDEFGYSVAVSGTTAIVGAEYHAFAGGAYVFTKTPTGWKQTAELSPSDGATAGDFGTSVAISGATAVVGASGVARAYMFAKGATGWKQTAVLKGSFSFGASVAVSGNTVVVGAPNAASGAGRAYIFTTSATGWKQAAVLKGSDTKAGVYPVGDQFGTSVAISGTTAVIGANCHAKNAGRAYVFTKTTTGWKQAAELKGSDTVAFNYFGWSVAVAGTTVVVGADDAAYGAGRAYVFTKTAKGWKQAAELKGSDTVAGDSFGYSAAVSGTTAVVGGNCHANYAGRAYVFEA